MNEELLKKASKEHVEVLKNYKHGLVGIGMSMLDYTDIQVSYEMGARWYVALVWKGASVPPENGKMLLCKAGENVFIGGLNNTDWEETVKMLGIELYAYVEDLMPNLEEEIQLIAK